MTHCGLFRYKRLLFGVNSASEQYQHEIQTALAGIGGQENISDKHDANLELVIKRLGERGLTLNGAKCQFSMDKLTFVWMVLSANGISCAGDKVEAVTSAREPQNASKTRSFLGLVNYCGRFIPDLATISERLRGLTKAGTPFVFGKEQKEAFEEFKKRLSNSETLGYFDKDAPTLEAVWTQTNKDGPRIIRLCKPKYRNKIFTKSERGARTHVGLRNVPPLLALHLWRPIRTRNRPLEVNYGPRSKPCARIERWVLSLLSSRSSTNQAQRTLLIHSRDWRAAWIMEANAHHE